MIGNVTSSSHKKPITLPLPPESASVDMADKALELEVYALFMRHLRHVPNSRMEIKILSAVQFTADMSDYSDAHITKMLVEMGLRAPRMAFPAAFLEYADGALLRPDWAVGGAPPCVQELKDYWDQIGEDKFAAIRKDFPLHEEYAGV